MCEIDLKNSDMLISDGNMEVVYVPKRGRPRYGTMTDEAKEEAKRLHAEYLKAYMKRYREDKKEEIKKQRQEYYRIPEVCEKVKAKTRARKAMLRAEKTSSV
jgi:DNA repair photolyase